MMKEIVKTLPQKRSNWLKGRNFYNYQGHWYSQIFLEGVILAQESFKAQSNDILVCSCLKTGTTWLKALAFAITTRKSYDESTSPLLTTMPHDCIPFLEQDLDVIQNNQKNTGFPLLATHVPYASLPKSVVTSNCKIVYIYRNVKDVIVSNCHFACKINKIPEEESSFDEAFVEYCEGFSQYGPYWDHVLGYWNASQERPDRFLLLKYEDMQMDASRNVIKLADFLGHPFSIEEEKSGMVKDIIKLCSFQNLSNLEVNKSGEHRPVGPMRMKNQFYFRKGEIRDWKNYFTEEMKEKIDKIVTEKLSGTDLVLSD